MAEYRLASYSARKCLGKNGKVSGKAINEAVKRGEILDFEITSMFDPDCGRYISNQELKARGESEIIVRYNMDRDIAPVKL